MDFDLILSSILVEMMNLINNNLKLIQDIVTLNILLSRFIHMLYPMYVYFRIRNRIQLWAKADNTINI